MFLLSAVVSWSLRNRAVVLLSTLLFVAFGIRAAVSLPIDAVPDVTGIQVQIITSAPALSPVEIERYVTAPVEREMAGIPKVTQVRSISKYGLSVVTIVFDDVTDIYFARQVVLERMRQAEDVVPHQYGRPQMGPIATGLGEIFQFAVLGEGQSLMQLQETLDWYIGPQLRTVPGVVEVNSLGGEDRQYQVVIDPKRLQAAGLSVQEVITAIERSNANAGGGYLERDREQLVIGTVGLVRSLADLQSVVVGATAHGVPITVANIGEVRFGARLRRGAASLDGRGEVAVGVTLMLMGENSRSVTAAVKAKLREIEPSLPPGTRIEPFYDRAELVTRTISTVAINLLEGAALVIVVLLLLLGDLRAGLIVASTIPLAMLFAIVLMNATGISGNLMSLGAVDFGLIVDGSVIIVENAVRRLRESQVTKGSALSNQERSDVVDAAAVEVRSASVFGEFIIGVVYVPILALRGIEGKLFHPMATTVLFALAGAFIVSLTVVPVLASLFLRPGQAERETWFMRASRRLYVPILSRVMRARWRTVMVGLVFLTVGATVLSRLGAEFVPQLDEGDLLVEVRRLPGVALTESIATDHRIQQSLLKIPEVSHVVSKTGSPALATDSMGIEETDVYVALRPRSEWRAGLDKEGLKAAVAEAIERDVPEVSAALSQPIQMRTNELVAGTRSDVAVQIYGADLDRLQRLGDEVASSIRAISGAVDVRAAQTAGLTYLRIRPDRARLARYGLTMEDVNTLTETIAVGRPAGSVFEGDRRFALVVKIDHQFQGDLDAMRSLPLRSSLGQTVPLGDVADVAVEKGPALVNREEQSRRLTVEFNIRGRDVVSVVRDAQAAVSHAVALPTAYRLEWGGQFENYLAARRTLVVLVPLALGLIFFMLWLAFQEMRPALLIFVNIPFAAVGGVLALWSRGMPFSISAGVGFIALFGVAVLNGLVLMSFTRHLERDGASPVRAVFEAAELRLRPVLMTAFVAALGFVPMALSRAPGSEVQRPLATVVIGGLVSATALTLLLFPAMYALVHRKAEHQRER